MNDRFEQLAALIDTSQRARFGHGVPPEIVADAEQYLGISFPPSYRWWLLNYGGGYIGGHELLGLAPELNWIEDIRERFIPGATPDACNDVLFSRERNRRPESHQG